jgi:hypothetical protein
MLALSNRSLLASLAIHALPTLNIPLQYPTSSLHSMYTGSLSPQERLAQFPAYSLTANLSSLPDGDRAALTHLIRAGKLLDELYLSQWWHGNVELRKKLVEQGDKEVLEVFDMYKGPYGLFHGVVLMQRETRITRHSSTMFLLTPKEQIFTLQTLQKTNSKHG